MIHSAPVAVLGHNQTKQHRAALRNTRHYRAARDAARSFQRTLIDGKLNIYKPRKRGDAFDQTFVLASRYTLTCRLVAAR